MHRYLDSPLTGHWSNSLSGFDFHHDDYRFSWNIADQVQIPERWPTDVLFFLFYTATGDALQLLAGSLLYDKGWRYNKVSGSYVLDLLQIRKT